MQAGSGDFGYFPRALDCCERRPPESVHFRQLGLLFLKTITEPRIVEAAFDCTLSSARAV